MPTTIEVPKPYQPGVLTLIRLSDEQAAELLHQLKNATPALFPKNLVAEVARRIKSIKRGELRDLIETLVGMHIVRSRVGLSADEFTEKIIQALGGFQNASFSDEDKKLLKNRLPLFLDLGESLQGTSKTDNGGKNRHTINHRREFNTLVNRWRSETGHLSSLEKNSCIPLIRGLLAWDRMRSP